MRNPICGDETSPRLSFWKESLSFANRSKRRQETLWNHTSASLSNSDVTLSAGLGNLRNLPPSWRSGGGPKRAGGGGGGGLGLGLGFRGAGSGCPISGERERVLERVCLEMEGVGESTQKRMEVIFVKFKKKNKK